MDEEKKRREHDPRPQGKASIGRLAEEQREVDRRMGGNGNKQRDHARIYEGQSEQFHAQSMNEIRGREQDSRLQPNQPGYPPTHLLKPSTESSERKTPENGSGRVVSGPSPEGAGVTTADGGRRFSPLPTGRMAEQ